MLFYPKEVFSVVVIRYNRKGAVDRSSRYGDIQTYGRTDDIGIAVGIAVRLTVGMAVGLTVGQTKQLRSQAVKLQI